MGARRIMREALAVLWGSEHGGRLAAEFARLEGGPCPCQSGDPCPCMPRQVTLRVAAHGADRDVA